MTEELQQDLLHAGAKYFNGLKSMWSGQDLQDIYRLYNLLTGQNKQDTQCPSCRRQTINYVRDQYVQLKKSIKPPQTNI